MGCDIHASVERCVYPAKDGRKAWWATVADIGYLPRDYKMFAAMVDGHSRDYNKDGGVAPERGLPPQPSEITGSMEWQREHPDDYSSRETGGVFGADHTISWLTPAEFRAAIELTRERSMLPVAPEYLALAEYLNVLERHGDVRLVFGFDN